MWREAILILMLATNVQFYILSQPVHPDLYRSSAEICTNHGYTCDEYFTATEDGYILSSFRVFKTAPKGHPVLMLHGFSSTSDNYIININTKPPAFKLVDAGFDVWLLNSRGNIYSRAHASLDPESKAYWNWTAAEIARYDLLAFVNNVKRHTKQEKVALVGHSQGGTVMLAALCQNPEFEDSVSVAVSIGGTGGSFSNPSLAMRLVTSGVVIDFLEMLGIYKLLDNRSVYMAQLATAFPWVGRQLFGDQFDAEVNGDDYYSVPYYLGKSDGGTSTENLRFIGSFFREDKKILMPDYGKERNLKLYKMEKPEVLDYTRIRTKVAVFGGKFDRIILKEDVDHLYDQIDKDKVMFFKSDYHIDHLGFLYSKNDEYLKDLIKVLKMVE